MTFPLSYQYGHKNGVAYFHFEQLSIISVVSLLLTFNKYTASGVLSFSILHFNILKNNQEHKCTSEHLRRNKQEMGARKKTIEVKQTILLDSM